MTSPVIPSSPPDHRALRRRRRRPLPAGPAAPDRPVRRPRRGHRRRQHRRRHLAARPQGLPRPGHRDVHPRRRHRRRSAAGDGTTRPGTPRRSSRRTASSRPGSGWGTGTSPPTWSAPRCSRRATRSRRSPTALCERWQPGVRLLPMSDDRVETHVVDRRRRRAVRAARDPLPGVLGAAARRGPRPGRGPGRPRPVLAGPRRRGGDHRRRPAWCCRRPTRWCRSAPSSACPGSATPSGRPPRRSSASPRSSRATTSAGWPPSCSARSAWRSAPRRWPSTTAPAARGGVLDGWLVDTRRRRRRRAGAGRGHRLPRRTADDDRPRRHGRDGRGDPRPRRRRSAGDRSPEEAPGALTCLPVDGVGEVDRGRRPGRPAARRRRPGRTATSWWSPARWSARPRAGCGPGDREEALAAETDRVVATRGRTSIVRTHHGLVMAAAGIDASNTEPGHRGAAAGRPRRLGAAAARVAGPRTGRNVAVLVTDTAGRAWRDGQTDIAVGAAGLDVLHDYAGRADAHGNELAVTAPAVADELAAAADLVKGKLDRRPGGRGPRARRAGAAGRPARRRCGGPGPRRGAGHGSVSAPARRCSPRSAPRSPAGSGRPARQRSWSRRCPASVAPRPRCGWRDRP